VNRKSLKMLRPKS